MGGAEEFIHQFQQPLTALRLMVEALQRGLVSPSPELHGSLLDCLMEMQGCVDAMNGISPE